MRPGRRVVQAVIILSILISASISTGTEPVENVVSLGLGLPYGGVGVNYELGITDYVAPTLGVGYLPDNLGWNLGLRLYYPGRDDLLRGRVTVLYGTNTLLQETKGGSDYKTENGFSAGIGCDWRFRSQWGLGVDLFVSNTDEPEGYEKKDNSIFLGLGVSYRW